MSRRSMSGGVTPIGQHRIQFDFTIDGVRYRPTLPWIPTEQNLRRARQHLAGIKTRIAAGTFRFTEDFPDFRFRTKLPLALRPTRVPRSSMRSSSTRRRAWYAATPRQ